MAMRRGCLLYLFLGVYGLYAQQFPVLSLQRFYDNLGDDIPAKILRSNDAQLLIGGTTWYTQPSGEEGANIYIIKLGIDGELIWERDIAINGYQELRDMSLSPGGEIVFVGVSNSMINHEEAGGDTYWGDFIVGKLDTFGQVIWLQSYGGRNLDQAYAVSAISPDGYVIAGGTHSTDGDILNHYGMSDAWVLQIDEEGEKGFSKNYGGAQNEWITSIASCKNGDFLLTGFTNSTDLSREAISSYGNGFLIRITANGDLRWHKVFACPDGGYFTDVVEAKDEAIFVVGNKVVEKQGKQFWWMCLKPNGEVLFEKIAPGPNDERLETVTACSDGGFLMGGYGHSKGLNGPFTKGRDDFWLVRTDMDGEVIWRKTYGGPNDERCYDLLEYSPGVYYAVGSKYNDFQEGKDLGKDFWLIKIEEYSCEDLEVDIFVRAPKFRVRRNQAVRFRARHTYGDRFYWNFGDGTTSKEEQPLKVYEYPGVYQVSLSVYTNEACHKTVWLPKSLKVD